MKTFVASLVCSLTLLTATAGAQVPRVLGVWELDPAASSLPQGFPLALARPAATICATTDTWSTW